MKNLPIFLLLLFFISCGDNNEKKAEEKKETKTEETTPEDSANETRKKILFFGNSLTAGMGLETEEAFPAVIQEKIDSLGLNYEAVNAGLSGETTASGKNRLSWVLKQDVDIFVLELGANDGLRGIPLEETQKNLQEIIDKVLEQDPEIRIVLAGMQIPPNMGEDYASGFREIFPELAEKNDVELIPFLLEDVAGEKELNQSDGIHPTVEGQKILAKNVWEVLAPMLKKEQETLSS